MEGIEKSIAGTWLEKGKSLLKYEIKEEKSFEKGGELPVPTRISPDADIRGNKFIATYEMPIIQRPEYAEVIMHVLVPREHITPNGKKTKYYSA